MSRYPCRLQTAKGRVADLQQQLAAARAEAAHWREQHQLLAEQLQRPPVAGSRDDASSGPDVSGGSVAKMQERLARLRKEQTDADAARESAWEDLKAVVADIASLASVDNLQSVRALGFGTAIRRE
jgi:hypothetical protein